MKLKLIDNFCIVMYLISMTGFSDNYKSEVIKKITKFKIADPITLS